MNQIFSASHLASVIPCTAVILLYVAPSRTSLLLSSSISDFSSQPAQVPALYDLDGCTYAIHQYFQSSSPKVWLCGFNGIGPKSVLTFPRTHSNFLSTLKSL